MTAPDRDDALPRKRGRSVPAIYGIVSLVLVVGAVTFALSTPPPNTPPLAAVAPAPQEQLEVERVEQSSQFGEGAGGEGDCVPGDPGCEGAPPPATDDTGSGAAAGQDDHDGQGEPDVVETRAPGELRRCAYGPGGPRQTEDPQSPPCKQEIFTGDNGGATWTGVDARTIRIAVPQAFPLSNVVDEAGAALIAHIAQHYELYGRSIELVEVPLPDGDRRDPAVQRAAAAEVAAAEVFASLEYPGFGPFHAELARRGIVSFTGGSWEGTVREADLAPLHPHVWATYLSFEDVQHTAGRLVCDALAGRTARHGGPDVRDRDRHFGVIAQRPTSTDVLGLPPDILLSRMEACGATHDVYDEPAEAADIATLVQRMHADGVTTVVCACRAFKHAEDYFDAADGLEYEPEWLLAGPRVDFLSIGHRGNVGSSGYSRRQMAHVFGLDTHLRRPALVGARDGRNYDEQYWFHAARDHDPALAPQQAPVMYYDLYGQLLMLASGVQWAGPELTPEAFGAALTGLRYPNPDVGVPRWFQPTVGFGPSDHAFNSDVSLYWWRDPDDASYQARTYHGEMCYVGDGRRFTAATIPAGADELLFDLEAGCR